MLSYAGVCSLWIPLFAWMMPSHSFRVGMMYLRRKDWTFEVRLRTGGVFGVWRSSVAGFVACKQKAETSAAQMSRQGSAKQRHPSALTVLLLSLPQSLRASTAAQHLFRTLWPPPRCTRPMAAPGELLHDMHFGVQCERFTAFSTEC